MSSDGAGNEVTGLLEGSPVHKGADIAAFLAKRQNTGMCRLETTRSQ